MRLSKRTEYGVRAVVQLARRWPHKFMQARELAAQEDLPTKFLESILLDLRRGGFLESKIGRDGGYRLARVPGEVRVGDVIRLLEDRLTHKEEPANQDRSPGEAAVHLINDQLTQATDDVLDRITLEQLIEHVNRTANVSQQMYYI